MCYLLVVLWHPYQLIKSEAVDDWSCGKYQHPSIHPLTVLPLAMQSIVNDVIRGRYCIV